MILWRESSWCFYLNCHCSILIKALHKFCLIEQEYGTVTKVNVLQNSATQSSRGLAFVTFESPYYAALAVENSPDG